MGHVSSPLIMKPLRFVPLDVAACVAFLAYSASATVTPIVLVQMSRELGFGLAEGGGLEVGRSALIFLTLLGSGFLAAHFGKARSLGMSLLLLGLGMILYSRAESYGILLMALALAGVGGGILEALINPLVEELHRGESGPYLNIINGFWSVGVLVTVLLGGEQITRSGEWRPVLQTVAGVSLLAGILFLGLRNLGPPRQRISMGHVLGHKVEILRNRGFWLFTALMFFGGAAEGSFTFWSASYVQLVHGGSARAGGWGAGLFSLGMIVTRFAGGWWGKPGRMEPFVRASMVLGLVVSIAFPFLPPGPLFGLGLFLAGVSVASFWPSLQSLAVDRLPLDPTALFILLSCGGIAGFSFSSWLVGLLGEHLGLSKAFGVVPLLFLVLLGLFRGSRTSGVERA